jgi:hypothetical protein
VQGKKARVMLIYQIRHVSNMISSVMYRRSNEPPIGHKITQPFRISTKAWHHEPLIVQKITQPFRISTKAWHETGGLFA